MGAGRSETVRRGEQGTDIDTKQAPTDTGPSPVPLLSHSRVEKRVTSRFGLSYKLYRLARDL